MYEKKANLPPARSPFFPNLYYPVSLSVTPGSFLTLSDPLLNLFRLSSALT